MEGILKAQRDEAEMFLQTCLDVKLYFCASPYPNIIPPSEDRIYSVLCSTIFIKKRMVDYFANHCLSAISNNEKSVLVETE